MEARIPAKHPLRAMRRLTNAALAELDGAFSGLYDRIGRPSIAPERLLRATLLQLLYTIRSERQLVERIEFDLLFRWFVGLSIDETVFDASTFSKNRDRLLTQEIAQKFLASLIALPEVMRLLSAEPFSVDGTLLKAWASMKSFQPKSLSSGEDPRNGSGSPPSGRNGETDFRKTKRSNATHASTTDKDARLFRKAKGQESRLAYLGHTLMENRNGLIVATDATLATGTAEREAAATFSERLPEGATLGADKNYDVEALGRRAEGARDRAACGDQRNGEQERRGAQDRRPERSRIEPGLCDQPTAAQAHRGRLRLGQDGGRPRAGESARPRQGPRRLRLRHSRLRYRPSAKAPRPDGRNGSGGMKRGDRCPEP
jgi:transposase